jgi:hypothetical protein
MDSAGIYEPFPAVSADYRRSPAHFARTQSNDAAVFHHNAYYTPID